MASGTISMTNSVSSLQGRISWSSTTNYTGGYSSVVAYLQIKDTEYEFDSYTGSLEAYYGGGSLATSDTFSSKTVSTNGAWTTVATIKFNPLHKDDGNCTIGFKANVKGWSGAAGDAERTSTTSKVIYVSLDRIHPTASITSAPNFTDEQNPTITYSNSAGNTTTLLQACISLDGSKADIAYRDISKTGTSYTFNLTDAERTLLRNATLSGSNTRKVKFYIKTTLYGQTKLTSLEKTLTIANATPSVSVSFEEADGTCANLTQGNTSDVYIKGFSDIYYTVSGTALKGATITKYKTTLGSASSSKQTGTFTNIQDNKLVFEASDNRGLTGKKEFTLDVVNYFPITCSFTTTEMKLNEDGATSTARITISGEFYNSTFGAKGVKNEMKIEAYDEATDSWWEVPDILWGDGISGNKYEASFNATVGYDESITFAYRASDKLTSAETDKKVMRLLPVFDWSGEDFNFNVPVNIKGDLTVEGNIYVNTESDGAAVDYVVETGTEAMGSNGTWYWYKWKSGRAECFGVRNFGNMGVSTAWGSLYTSEEFSQELPSGLFNNAPVCNINFHYSSSGYSWIVKGGGTIAPSATNTGNFKVVRGASITLSAARLSFYCIGTWK